MPKVMLIEDDDTMRFLLMTLLQIEGYQVVENNGRGEMDEMLQEIDNETPDVIYMDVHIGEKNGIDLLKLIRKDEKCKSNKVLMSSGMELSRECDQEGADGFIIKPFMPEELIDKIKDLLGN